MSDQRATIEITATIRGVQDTRRCHLGDLGPADDKLATQIAGTVCSASDLLEVGSPSSALLAWLIAGRQAGVRGEHPERLADSFTLAAMDQMEVTVIGEPQPATDAEEDPT